MLLSSLAWLALAAGTGRTDPAEEIDAAVARGVALLLEKQESLSEGVAGEWPYEGVYRVPGKSGPEIPIGYRIGGTSIVATALLECADSAPRDQVDPAIARALDFVLAALDDERMSAGFSGRYDVRGWGHAYALDFLLRLRAKERVPEKLARAVDERIQKLVAILKATEIAESGGWNYARGPGVDTAPASPFMTAPTLQILFEAARQGVEVDEELVGRALDTLEKARRDNGAVQYATRPPKDPTKAEPVEGAIGRMPVAEVTLHLAGRGSVERIRSAVRSFFEHWEWLEKRRKQIGTHEPPYGVAPYYFFYAHRYVAQAIEMLPEAECLAQREKLRELLWRVRETSGGWNDRVFPRSESFGTAMALFALRSPGLPEPAAWSAK